MRCMNKDHGNSVCKLDQSILLNSKTRTKFWFRCYYLENNRLWQSLAHYMGWIKTMFPTMTWAEVQAYAIGEPIPERVLSPLLDLPQFRQLIETLGITVADDSDDPADEDDENDDNDDDDPFGDDDENDDGDDDEELE